MPGKECATYYHENGSQYIYGEFGETKAIHFEGRVGIVVEDGQVESANGRVSIENATKAVIYLSAVTSFNGFDQLPGKDFEALTRGK